MVLGAMMAMATSAPVAHGQTPSRLPLIAILEPGSASTSPGGVPHFKRALAELGWVEGRTVRIETRYSDWAPNRMATMAKELAALKPDVLYTHSVAAVRAAVGATTSIPIVVGAHADLLATGAARSLARPGGNVTGVTHAASELDHKRLEVLKEAVPSASRIAFLVVPASITESRLRGLDDSARRLGVRLQHVGADEPSQIEAAFTAVVKDGAHAILVQDNVVFSRNVDRIAVHALRHRLPTLSQIPRFAERGGLLQYGADVFELFRQSATHVDKILRGAKPGDLPIEQPTKVELIVNLKTAKAIGITIPQAIMVRADRVIR